MFGVIVRAALFQLENFMSLFSKLVIGLIIAAIATVVVTRLHVSSPVELGIVFAVATCLTVILGNISFNVSLPSLGGGDREKGTVKWFNVSKGFGFIVREDGEEIFVHFRSIKGSGRRGLNDGQAVSFVVRDSDKGPQAEEVEGL
jgi:CspA family cold shock protein